MTKQMQQIKMNQLLINISVLMYAHPDLVEVFDHHINVMLDTMNDNDTFGSEGQLDPRGDNRG